MISKTLLIISFVLIIVVGFIICFFVGKKIINAPLKINFEISKFQSF